VPARKANSAEKTALKESEHFTVNAPIINYFAINGMHSWKPDWKHIQPIVQIGTKFLVFDHGL
jgi:hypothetical protein